MQLVLEQPDYSYILRSADGHCALVNERVLERSFIVSTRVLIEDWLVSDVQAMTPEDLELLLALAPEVVLIGTGERQAFLPPATLAASLKRRVGLETMTNAAAARTFNVLAGEGRQVVAGFVLTAG